MNGLMGFFIFDIWLEDDLDLRLVMQNVFVFVFVFVLFFRSTLKDISFEEKKKIIIN